ncbi:MAG: hypothetical protein GF331_19270 [Chitinivibrionales bacterium]|nr:hypothetical protein [Chitinivibrionales bacterium]
MDRSTMIVIDGSLGEGGGRFRCLTPTEHARTNAAVTERFTGARCMLTKGNEREWKIAWDG